ncbi:type II secretion system protein N [Rhodanobacter ginsenosidimutans]|uniref:Type II secretion system protein N n=1 Tax=Rhodanobacter ginsenosidimutans TaxID=490571 RepID=A0ABW0JVZ3_9GAMM
MTRLRTWRSGIVGGGVVLAACALFLVVLAPATLIDSGLRRATHGVLRLAQAQGTLWSGSGRLEIRDPARQTGIGKAVAWVWRPRSLLHGRLGYQVSIDHAAGFPLHLSAHGVDVADVDFSVPAAALGLAVPRMASLGLRGDVAVRIARFTRTDDGVWADAVVTWKDAGSALTTVVPLGTYALRIDSVAGALNASLHTRSGPLQLRGGGSWRSGMLSDYSVTARVDAKDKAQLAPLLRLIAIERANGDFALQFGPPLSNVSAANSPETR